MMHTNDQQLLYGDNGIGIVLIHGVTSGCAQMVPLGKMLNDYGYSVHCVNIAGHGTYPQELLRTSWKDAIDKACYDYDRMKANYEKVYIGGLSMGGCLSLALAAQRDDIDGVISMSAPSGLCPNVLSWRRMRRTRSGCTDRLREKQAQRADITFITKRSRSRSLERSGA